MRLLIYLSILSIVWSCRNNEPPVVYPNEKDTSLTTFSEMFPSGGGVTAQALRVKPVMAFDHYSVQEVIDSGFALISQTFSNESIIWADTLRQVVMIWTSGYADSTTVEDSLASHLILITNNADSITSHRTTINDILDSLIVHRTDINAGGGGGGSGNTIYSANDSIDDPDRYIKMDSAGTQLLRWGHMPNIYEDSTQNKYGFFVTANDHKLDTLTRAVGIMYNALNDALQNNVLNTVAANERAAYIRTDDLTSTDYAMICLEKNSIDFSGIVNDTAYRYSFPIRAYPYDGNNYKLVWNNGVGTFVQDTATSGGGGLWTDGGAHIYTTDGVSLGTSDAPPGGEALYVAGSARFNGAISPRAGIEQYNATFGDDGDVLTYFDNSGNHDVRYRTLNGVGDINVNVNGSAIDISSSFESPFTDNGTYSYLTTTSDNLVIGYSTAPPDDEKLYVSAKVRINGSLDLRGGLKQYNGTDGTDGQVLTYFDNAGSRDVRYRSLVGQGGISVSVAGSNINISGTSLQSTDQSGSVSTTADGSGDVTVTFGTAHSTTPVVMVQATGSRVEYIIQSKSTTNFVVRAFDTEADTALVSTAVTFDWISKE